MTVLVKNARIVTAADESAADIVIDGKLMHTLGRAFSAHPQYDSLCRKSCTARLEPISIANGRNNHAG